MLTDNSIWKGFLKYEICPGNKAKTIQKYLISQKQKELTNKTDYFVYVDKNVQWSGRLQG